MKVTRFALVAVVLAWASIASAQTVDEVIEKSITAMGGRPAMEKIKTRSMTGTLSLSTPAGDIPGTVEIQNAAPNKMRTVIKADLSAFGAGQLLIDQRFDGTNGYMINSLQGDQPNYRRPAREHEGQLVSASVPRLQGQGRQGDTERQGKGRRARCVRLTVRADARLADQAVH